MAIEAVPILSVVLGLTHVLNLETRVSGVQYASSPQQARIEDFPYLASLRVKDVHQCGGSIISENKILTAAHCVANIAVTELNVRVGSTQRFAGDSYAVRHATVHPSFNQTYLQCDVAILTLGQDLTFGPFVKSIQLAEKPSSDGTLASVMWWSDTPDEFINRTPKMLHVATVRLISKASCRASYPRNLITAVMLCADGGEFGTDPCQLDSGSPLVDKSTGKQVGVVSWVGGCFRPALPMVATSVGVSVKSRDV